MTWEMYADFWFKTGTVLLIFWAVGLTVGAFRLAIKNYKEKKDRQG